MRTVEKPWGKEEIWAETDRYAGKFLYIEPGEMLSRQYHERKEETICVIDGVLQLEIGQYIHETRYLYPGDTFHVTPGTIHRFCCFGRQAVKLVEVSTPELDDVVRLEDKYAR